MLKRSNFAAGVLTLAVASVSYGITVDSTGILDPNPSNLAITEVGNSSLAASRALITAGRATGSSGVVDFQQQAQGGTFPNSTNTTNGTDFATNAANPLLVTATSAGPTGALVATGPTIFSFYRSDAITAGDTNANDNIDSNLNQGANTISGGYLTRFPGAVSASNPLGDGTTPTGVNPAYTFTDAPGATIGGAYVGITGAASPATLVFNTPLSFFGITALPRGATRDSLITLTEVPVDAAGIPIAGGAPISVAIGGATVVGTAAVFFGQTANVGYVITSAAITNPNAAGQNRYDDLAFVVAVPEPGSLALLGLGGLAALRRRRA